MPRCPNHVSLILRQFWKCVLMLVVVLPLSAQGVYQQPNITNSLYDTILLPGLSVYTESFNFTQNNISIQMLR